ncbi:MAG: hypothetical protein RBT65_03790 [Methanolobus sp.]|nr:hypothetical protein [Methanolobus sp.]
MSEKIILTLCIVVSLFFISNAAAEASFTNDLNIQDASIDFVINEFYTGVDADAFRNSLDIDENGEVSTLEVDMFVNEFATNNNAQYLGYIIIDDGDIPLSISSFNLEVMGAEGSENSSEIHVQTNIRYNFSSSLATGKHSVWVLGHPSIERMSISIPQGTQILNVDGLDYLEQSRNNGRVLLEGRSGIRSFMAKERQTFEYAVLIDTYKSAFIADLSLFEFVK